MPETQPDLAPPTSMPVLSRGKHSNPARGACFMEYTSVLAGGSPSPTRRAASTRSWRPCCGA